MLLTKSLKIVQTFLHFCKNANFENLDNESDLYFENFKKVADIFDVIENWVPKKIKIMNKTHAKEKKYTI